ncbi:MAG: phosphatidylglycerophosphatase A [Desulfobacterales bacterium]|nr:phosphatidylglycerophosphatase A [Desulfobacterales bacterium]
MKPRKHLTILFATGGGVGNIPFAPGTFGSAAAIPLCFAFSRIPLFVVIPCAVAFTLFAIRVAGKAEAFLHEKDPGCIVIDEMAGMVVTFLGAPFNLFTALAGFVLFRVFDILKPFPIRALERRLPGGLGIVMDDVAAGVCANVLLRIGYFLINGQPA